MLLSETIESKVRIGLVVKREREREARFLARLTHKSYKLASKLSDTEMVDQAESWSANLGRGLQILHRRVFFTRWVFHHSNIIAQSNYKTSRLELQELHCKAGKLVDLNFASVYESLML